MPLAVEHRDAKRSRMKAGINFMDVTDTLDLGTVRTDATVKFPNKPAYNDSLVPLLKELKQKNMHKNLEKFTSFHTVRAFRVLNAPSFEPWDTSRELIP